MTPTKPTCRCRTRHTPLGPCSERRLLLGLAALSALGGLGACGDASNHRGQPPAPVEITSATACELDGMLLADYGGPKGQIHYAGVAQPTFLCDTVEVFSMLLNPEQVRKVAAIYVQDMGTAAWDEPRGHWIDATSAFYVHGSKRLGSMGPTIASFAAEADARKFAAEYGGRLLRYVEIKPEMVDLGGGAKQDTRM